MIFLCVWEFLNCFLFYFVVRFPKGIEISRTKIHQVTKGSQTRSSRQAQAEVRKQQWASLVYSRGIKGGESNRLRYSELPVFSWMNKKELDTCMFTCLYYMLVCFLINSLATIALTFIISLSNTGHVLYIYPLRSFLHMWMLQNS